jgi:flagellin
MSVINTNIKALYTQNALLRTERAQSEAMQQLATGKRINSARDDAAGLAISQRMTQQIRSLNMAVKNAGDAISLIQTAEGATASITDMLQRMRELAVQSANATNADDQRGYLDLEFQQLKQQIQSISEQTMWNGFSILNGTAGEAVGERPVYKVTSEAQFSSDLAYSASVNNKDNDGVLTFSNNLAKAGTLNISVNSDDEATATLTLPDGTTHTLTGTSDGTSKITFANTILTDGTGNFVITSTGDDAEAFTSQSLTLSLSLTAPSQPTVMANDTIINGVTIPMTTGSVDRLSTTSASASTIAKVAAINQMTPDTGVVASINPTTMSGSAMSGADVVKGTVTINGYTTALFSTSENNLRESRTTVADAINAISAQTGVIAINSDTDARGISLVAADGRNIEVSFNTADTAAAFAARTGLKQGLQTGSYSLESTVEGPIVVTSTGNWQNAGLPPGNYTTNTSAFTSAPRPVVQVPDSGSPVIEALGDGDLIINGFPIRGAVASDDTRSFDGAVTSSRAGSAIAIAAAINERSADTGVIAIASPAVTEATSSPSTGTTATPAHLFINGVDVQINLVQDETATDRLNHIIAAVNRQQGMHGVVASATADGRLHLETRDGRNLSVWYDSTAIEDPRELGLAGSAANGIENGASDSTDVSTVYGTVRLQSDKPITLTPGNNGFTSEGDFTSLGFQEGTFGGEVTDAGSKLTPPRTGRLTFHVGAAASQVISIDLADYGSKGPITSEVTGDVDVTDPAQRTNRIDTVDSATSMLNKLDTVLDRVNANRATMGAVMNRLDYVIDNLSNVSTNTEASRSQIEDADYAKASTALAKTQIMQQAATAVLAQANQSLQTVLKLLQ